MTKRHLPAAPSLTQAGVNFCIPDAVKAKWTPELRAAAKSDNNVISIFDYIGDDGMGGGFTSSRMAAALRSIGPVDVEVQINSPGGDFFEGLAMYNMLREHPAKVNVKVLALAGSAASIIAEAGDNISVAKAGLFFIHNVQGLVIGDRNDMAEAQANFAKCDAIIASIYASRTGMVQDEIANMMDEETWLSGTDAVGQGFADGFLASDQVRKGPKNEAVSVSALRRVDDALAKGERLSRSERRNLLKELTGKPSAAEEEGTPCAANDAVMDGETCLRFALARMQLARASL